MATDVSTQDDHMNLLENSDYRWKALRRRYREGKNQMTTGERSHCAGKWKRCLVLIAGVRSEGTGKWTRYLCWLQVTVYVRIMFLKVGEIDTLRDKFSADAFVQAKWREPSMDGKLRMVSSLEYIYHTDPLLPTLSYPEIPHTLLEKKQSIDRSS